MEIVLVASLYDAEAICNALMAQTQMIAMDIEGVDLNRGGDIALLQIATNEKKVFCFDILELGVDVFSFAYLGQVLESDRISKLCYDCRIDADVLLDKFGIKLQMVYDLQVLYTFAFQSAQDPFLKGMHHALQKPGILNKKKSSDKKMLVCKKDIKALLQSSPDSSKKLFMQRPISEKVLFYCISDVVYLFRMYRLWSALIPSSVVRQASMYRMHKYCYRMNRAINAAHTKRMARIDFKRMPVTYCCSLAG